MLLIILNKMLNLPLDFREMRKYLLILSYIVFLAPMPGQIKIPDYNVETGAIINFNDSTPFWLFNNQFGKYSLANSCGFMDITLNTKIDYNKNFDYEYGIELLFIYDNSLYPTFNNKNYTTAGNVLNAFQQAYLKIKLWNFLLHIGKAEENINCSDSLLSMGHILWSGNTRPLPKIQLSSNGYIIIPFTYKLLEVKGTYSHGWFNEERFVDNIYLHHKNLYGRAGGKYPIRIFFGLEHFAQWGGTSPVERLGKLPQDFNAYKHIIKAEGGDTLSVHPGEVTNSLGNHIGSWNFGLELEIENFSSKIYYQTIFEDNSGKEFKNFPDGLWGITCKFKEPKLTVKSVVFEFLHTPDQSGSIHDWLRKLGGNDNYFNHWIYKSGWTYNKMTVGTPFITSPIYHSDSVHTYLYNNRVKVHHFGIRGQFNDIQYKSIISYSKNYGTHSKPYSNVKNQLSVLMEAVLPVKLKYNFNVKGALAFDLGKMYGNNFGIFLSVIKSGHLKKDN